MLYGIMLGNNGRNKCFSVFCDFSVYSFVLRAFFYVLVFVFYIG